jgi:signal transduction histidine kinase
VGLAVCLVALHRLSDARWQVVDHIDPARVAAQQYATALVDQETGVRGFALTGRPALLTPFDSGDRAAAAATRRLRAQAPSVPGLDRDLSAVGSTVTGWRLLYAEPTVLTVRREGPRSPSLPDVAAGKVQFDRVRAGLRSLNADLARARASGRTRLNRAATLATVAVIAAGLLLVAAALVAGATLRRALTVPLARLARDARRVAHGDFAHRVAPSGPRDVVELGGDVDSMRLRIITELAVVEAARDRLEAQTLELQRSNAELEQFAYVASHDLQEPLRKVAAFCGMLRHRYAGQLDERADQYIAFAVEGAESMQVLINDLLEFSRVGRSQTEHVRVAMEEVVAAALTNLDTAIAEAGAEVEVGALPAVVGDRGLLVVLVQNLVANAVKFRGEAPPRVRVSGVADGALVRFAVDDNGIGIAPQYADRVFAVFQRLHTREEYEGTGIGLAMARKIVEFHGGEISVAPEAARGGASLRFTLPAAH